MLLLDHECVGIDEDCLDVVEIEIVKTKHEDARRRGNDDPQGVGQLQAAAAFPLLFGQQDAHDVAELDAIRLGNEGVMADALVEDAQPIRGKWLGEQVASASIAQPGKKHGLCPRNVAMRLRSFYTERWLEGC